MEFKAVLGANYGDEGKGRLVDFLADEMVARFSSSAQAGHTVTADGRRHVFHHFGSGALKGVPTFLFHGFLCHPLMFRREREDLLKMIAPPVVHVDPGCLLVLPSDMIINQALEMARGGDRHGSCGLGIRQAIERSTVPALIRRVGDAEFMLYEDNVYNLLLRHLETFAWMHGTTAQALLERVGVKDLRAVAEQFTGDLAYFLESVRVYDDVEEDLFAENVVLEGSQGLALDPGAGSQLPHLTPSNVGVGGVVPFLEEHFVETLELVYATRPYLTRHGAGPLPHEGEWTIPIVDQTNAPNEWQGSLRFAPLDMADMMKRIQLDQRWMALVTPEMRPHVRVSLGITCLDHVENLDFPFYDLHGERQNGLTRFLNEAERLLGHIQMVQGEMGDMISCFGEERVDTDVSKGTLYAKVA